MSLPNLTQPQIEQIAQIFGNTDGELKGLKGFEIGQCLAQCRIPDPDSGITKWKRLYNAFCAVINNSSL